MEAAMGAMGDPDLWSLCPAIYWCGTPLDVRDGGESYGGGDLDRARALLADSGYDGETIILLGPLDHAWTGPLITPVAAS
ncbi:MAG: ABC transporter substrate-binding protein, partial [Candidatus Marinimicrobia bacterium]|nr:ABC transporter substrate-binding protein [Candidatus Neomarinimicrobiota bacterium]